MKQKALTCRGLRQGEELDSASLRGSESQAALYAIASLTSEMVFMPLPITFTLTTVRMIIYCRIIVSGSCNRVATTQNRTELMATNLKCEE